MLDTWPLLPIAVWSNFHELWGVDNIVAALEHGDRISEVGLFDIPSSQMERILAAMRHPSLELTRLELQPRDQTARVDPDLFLGGSAPRLQRLFLDGVPFSGLPKLLLSTTHLVDLDIRRISLSGYISPEAMVTAFALLTRLESVFIGFKSPRCYPDQSRRPPSMTRTLLPVLTKFGFKGVTEYLEDFVARIDAPQLNSLEITFFHQLVFDTPQLTQFIRRTPNFKAHDDAHVVFFNWDVLVRLPLRIHGALELEISCSRPDWQLSSLAQVCNLSFPEGLIPAVGRLYIESGVGKLRWEDEIESSQWLELFHPFTAVKDFYISSEVMPHVAPALQELVGEGGTEVLPSLQSLFLEEPLKSGPVQEAIGRFVAARQLAGHPIGISLWEREKRRGVV
jgi:hypothetical protein